MAPRVLVPTADVRDGAADASLTASIQRSGASQVITRPAATVVVARGQTLDSIAATYDASVATMRWANDVRDATQPEMGAVLVVPPGKGALVAVLPGERPSELATRLGIDPRVILDYNQLHRDDPLDVGTYLQVPEQMAPSGALLSNEVVPIGAGVPGVGIDQQSRGDIYPYGQCTWYVASRRNVTWRGDAYTWLNGARGIRPEGHTAVAGAIVVMSQGYSGHVGIVDQVNLDGSYVMSEMNYYGGGGGWGRVDQRVLGPNESFVMGFIY